MQYVIAVYRSRDVSMQVYNYLINNSVMAALISTPRGANVGCGLSVKISYGDYAQFANVLSQKETFAGFFLVRATMAGTVISRL